jgi:hypothetical protein
MGPGEVFARLWEMTERLLAEGSTGVAPEFRRTMGTIRYVKRIGILEGGEYDWQSGRPRILLFRGPAEDLPAQFTPDLISRPDEDACVLAHELGHFDTDATMATTAVAHQAWKANALSQADALSIYEEERAAWRRGAERLAQAGCTDFSRFHDLERQSLRGYAEGFHALTGITIDEG